MAALLQDPVFFILILLLGLLAGMLGGMLGVGALYKNITLAQHAIGHDSDAIVGAITIDWRLSLLIAAMLAPTAWLGSRLGAGLTHSLPLRQVRIVFIVLMAVAAWKMANLPITLY